jgi:hypothetical protein
MKAILGCAVALHRSVLVFAGLAVSLSPSPASAIPKRPGDCELTLITEIGPRLHGGNPAEVGVSVGYANGVYTTGYDFLKAVAASRAGQSGERFPHPEEQAKPASRRTREPRRAYSPRPRASRCPLRGLLSMRARGAALPPIALASRVGDRVRICLVSIPKGCPPGDERGRAYATTNLRTGAAWTRRDSAHLCGGA